MHTYNFDLYYHFIPLQNDLILFCQVGRTLSWGILSRVQCDNVTMCNQENLI
jgi:hypothetical protein